MTRIENINVEKLKKLRSLPSLFVKEVIGIEPFDYQKDVLDCNDDRIAFVSGRQVGKSRTAAWIGLHYALTREGATVLITAPTQNQASELFRQVKVEMNESVIPDDLWGTERETRTAVEFENGSRILCRPANDNLRGLTTELIIADEAAKIEDEIFYQVLLPMLATTDGKFVLTSTPFGSSGFLFEAFHGGLEEDYYTKQVPTYRNPKVGEEYIAQQQQQLSSLDFKQEILGKFVESSDSFFTTAEIEEAISGESSRSSNRCFLGVDLARHGEASTVYIAMDGDGNVFMCEQEDGTGLDYSLGRIKDLHGAFGFEKIAVDESTLGGGVVDMLKNSVSRGTVMPVTFSPKKKRNLYNTLKKKMEAGEISIPDHSELKKQMLDLEYEYTASGNMKVNAPDGGHDDFPDALALVAWAHEQSSNVRQKGPASF